MDCQSIVQNKQYHHQKKQHILNNGRTVDPRVILGHRFRRRYLMFKSHVFIDMKNSDSSGVPAHIEKPPIGNGNIDVFEELSGEMNRKAILHFMKYLGYPHPILCATNIEPLKVSCGNCSNIITLNDDDTPCGFRYIPSVRALYLFCNDCLLKK